MTTELLERAQRYIDRNADTGPETMVIELVREIERLRKGLSEIADGYIGDQSAEEQFLWAQRVARRTLTDPFPPPHSIEEWSM